MGKSKSETKSDQTATVAPNPIYSPYINKGADALQPAFEQAQANNQQLLGGVNKGLGYAQDVLGGKYLNGNPYLDAVIGRTNEDITQKVNGQFEGAGRYGSGMYAGSLAKAVADNENNLRYGNYATERGYQNNAPGQIAALTGISAALPQAASSTYADALKALLGGYTTGNQTGTSSTTSSPSILGMLLQAGAQVGSAFAGGG